MGPSGIQQLQFAKCVDGRGGPLIYKTTLSPIMWKEYQFHVIFVERLFVGETVLGITKPSFTNNAAPHFYKFYVLPFGLIIDRWSTLVH